MALIFAMGLFGAKAQVVVSEIMFHPSSHNPREEYVELYNTAATNVDISGWKLSKGINFTIPTNTTLSAASYLVVAADRNAFAAKYPGVANVVGSYVTVRITNIVGYSYTNFENTLSNTRDEVRLENAAGQTINSVPYADQGDWAIRQRGKLDLNYQGWTWTNSADGWGKSMELVNPALPNDNGQNWKASVTVNGTPGRANSVASGNAAPLVLDVAHSPIIPQSTNVVAVTARIIDESTNVTVNLFWRQNAGGTVPAFTTVQMFDDGAHGDGVANDGIYGALIPAQAHLTIVEFYVEAVDSANQTNSWPAPAIDTTGALMGHVANALYQVDNTPYTDPVPLHKIIMTPGEMTEFGNLLAGSPNSNAGYNCTVITVDGKGTEIRYLCHIRNRGHGSRSGTPHNYRIDFATDRAWHNVTSLNINARTVHTQIFGSTIARQAGVGGNSSRPLEIRINGGAGPGGTPSYGIYAENEVPDSDFAAAHFPNDAKGNVYSVFRDLPPPTMTWRGPSYTSYTNTYFKDSNSSENDFTDIIALHRIFGSNDLWTVPNVRLVLNPEQWLTHLAVMALFDNRETGLNESYNDDYEMYRGIDDPRFVLLFHDLDTIIGQGDTPGSTTATIFGAAGESGVGDQGTGAAMARLMHSTTFEPVYYQILQRLLNTTFAKTNFDAQMDQTLSYLSSVSPSTITTMKTWMDGRRTYVQGLISSYFSVNPPPPLATISGEPRSPTPFGTATLTVGGANVVSYRFKLNNGGYGAETAVGTPISLSGLANGSSNVVWVIGKTAAGAWQDTAAATMSKFWIVDSSVPTVRLNEVLADNKAALIHGGVYPDAIELYNEGAASVDLAGYRLSDSLSNPGKFTFPSNTVVAAGGYLIAYANNDDGSGGIHLGFALNADGDELYLFDRGSNATVLDSVVFGLQLPDLSIGRNGNSGDWRLGQPTLGLANTTVATGNRAALRINEWLASGTPPYAEDFVEIYNSGAPVDMGGCYFTDEPIGAPTLQQLPPLTFIGANSFLSFTADGKNSPHHLNFALSTDQDEVALLDPFQTVIDSVYFAAQQPNISQGRCPDGANHYVNLATPTPGLPNACPATVVPPPTVPLLTISNIWSYDQSGVNLGTSWLQTNDSAWSQGPGLLGTPNQNGTGTVPEPIRTILTTNTSRTTFYFRTRFTNNITDAIASLQVNHVIDDGAVFYLNGQEFYRYNMPAGIISYSTLASAAIGNVAQYSGAITVPGTNLLSGVNVVAVEVHQSSASSPDILFGTTLSAVLATNSASSAGVVINEVLANNLSLAETNGSTPDWVEFYNPSTATVNLADLSLTDDLGNPRRWVFGANTLIGPKGYLRVLFDANKPASTNNTGFGLKDTGDSVYLVNTPANGGGLLDWISFGLQAADFSIGRSPQGTTNWVLTVPTPGAANTAAGLGDSLQLKVNEWMANPGSGEDWFEIYNPAAQPVALSGLWLTDDLSTPSTRMKYQVPPLSFIGTGTGGFQKFDADNAPQNGPNHASFKLSNSGEALGISQVNGTLIDGVSFGAQLVDVSEGRFPDGTANIISFPFSASPGDMNWLPLPNIVINEVLTHTDPPLEDAIELQNTNGATVNIGGWYLTDSKNNLKKYQIPAGVTIPAGAFAVFYETQFNNAANAPLNFALSSAHGDSVYLSAATNGVLSGYRAFATFGAAANGVSFGRYRTSVGDVDFVAMSQRTFGADNPATVEEFRTGTGRSNAYPRVGPVVITEIMYHPPNLGTNDNTRDEFIELRNIASTNVPLYDPAIPTNRWRLRGGVDFDFPTVTLVPGQSIIVVGFDPLADVASANGFRAAYGLPSNTKLFGPWNGKLDNGSESISLYRPDAPQPAGLPDAGFVPFILTEKVVYSDHAPWPTTSDGGGMSLQRVSNTGYGNDVTNWVAAVPTPASTGGGPADTDGDGIPDTWEQAYGLNPQDPSDALADWDGDGMTNLQEYLAGTSPIDGSSVLKVSIARGSNAALVSFTAMSNVAYTVQYRTNAATGSWINLQSVPAAGTVRTISITNSAPVNPTFYRVTTP